MVRQRRAKLFIHRIKKQDGSCEEDFNKIKIMAEHFFPRIFVGPVQEASVEPRLL